MRPPQLYHVATVPRLLIPMFGVITMLEVGIMYLVQFDLLRRLYSEISEILHASISNTK